MITSIIFSKNRPLQLDLCLNSIKKNFSDSENIVIYTNSQEYKEAYDVLREEHPDIEYWPQSDSLFKDIYLAIINSTNEYICFFTDDNIVYNELPPLRMDVLDNRDIACFSLRMGVNINKRSHAGKIFNDVPSELYQIDDNTICWNRTRSAYGSYWSYSMSVDGHIFRKKDIEEMFDEMFYLSQRYTHWEQTPNRVESVMQRFWTANQSMMASFMNSVVVNSPNNRVQDSHLLNKSGEFYNYTSEDLLAKYLEEQRIDMNKLDFSNIECPHTEIDIMKGLV